MENEQGIKVLIIREISEEWFYYSSHFNPFAKKKIGGAFNPRDNHASGSK